MATSKEMTAGPALSLILKFTLPLLLGNLLQQTYSLVDAAIVGKFLGINSLASVGASTSVVFLILGFCNGCCGGFGIPVAQKFGARDYSTMRSYVAVSLKLAVGMSLVIAIITSIYCADILRVMRTPEIIFDGAYDYLLVTFIGIPATFFYNLLSSIIRALGDSKTPFWFLLLSTVLNIVLDLFCILVLDWGVAGAAIATVFSQGFSAILCYIYMYRKFEILRSSPKERRFQPKLAKTLLYIGVPMGLQFSITAIGSIMLQSANNALGTACVAAFTSAMRIKMFFICTFESLGIAMATYSGQNYGAGKPERIWLGIRASALMMVIYTMFTFIFLMVGAKYFALIFVDPSETEILKYTEQFLHVACCFFPALGLLCILRYTIQGVGYTNLAMFSGVSEMIARILVSIYAVPAFGFVAVCFGDPTAWIAADLFLIPAFVYVYRKLKKSCFTQAASSEEKEMEYSCQSNL
ncbi:MATE family efflux transporter [Bacteroides sp.]|uniref:MATE family efflux transporter n=1 Tax=Bacteroides sp. TaxID=29523 RepID=UPI00260DC2BE|nr:MATE family efflux transporter [Bacteroides sp.]MDD3036667.1 MATE family efflux transporter [Bacteroides sp.]